MNKKVLKIDTVSLSLPFSSPLTSSPVQHLVELFGLSPVASGFLEEGSQGENSALVSARGGGEGGGAVGGARFSQHSPCMWRPLVGPHLSNWLPLCTLL